MTQAELPPAERSLMESRLGFGERLAARCGDRQLALCAGIDPSPEATALLAHPAAGSGRTAEAAAIERFCAFVIEAVRDHAAVVKLQAAWFERAGWQGMRALERAIAYARTAGLLVILDGKRGDVPHSAKAYADAWLAAPDAGPGADALTVNASVGEDALIAMCEVAHARNCQVYALVHTSNPGARALQSAALEGGVPWWHLLARAVERSAAGAVVGATHDGLLAHARAQMPTAPLLVPGIGAQGGSVDEAAQAAIGSRAAPTLVACSRSLLPGTQLEAAAFREQVAAAAAGVQQLLDAAVRERQHG